MVYLCNNRKVTKTDAGSREWAVEPTIDLVNSTRIVHAIFFFWEMYKTLRLWTRKSVENSKLGLMVHSSESLGNNSTESNAKNGGTD